VHCVHSYVYKGFDENFFLKRNNLAPVETFLIIMYRTFTEMAVVYTLK
jgi:hypothetical protein